MLPTMPRPPPTVKLVARSHWLVGAVTAGCIALVHGITRDLPIAFSPKAYAITGSLAALYLLTGTLVWFGLPPGQPLSRFCALFYMIRPRLCFRLWDAMRLPEFKEHFRRGAPAVSPHGSVEPRRDAKERE